MFCEAEQLEDKLKLARILQIKLEKAQARAQAASALVTKMEGCLSLSTQLSQLDSLLGQVEEIQRAKSVNIPDVRRIDRTIDKREKIDKLESLLNNIKERDESWRKLKAHATQASDTLKVESEGTCPVCGGPLK
jgi:hypothetical protein